MCKFVPRINMAVSLYNMYKSFDCMDMNLIGKGVCILGKQDHIHDILEPLIKNAH